MMSVSDDRQAGIIDAFNTTSRYLDGILNINNVYLDNMVSKIYPSELKLNEANASDTEAAFLDLHLSISNVLFRPKFMFQGGTSLVDLFCYLCFLFVMFSCLFIVALWSPAGKGLTSWLPCVWCFIVYLLLSHVVSWVRCGAWVYRFLIFAFFLTLIMHRTTCNWKFGHFAVEQVFKV